uniref:Uncharacterized protein n=1 Tax=Anguilla anguilla TaxID=7936 RepID=A0A0E9X2T3_ANGAN
MTRLAVEGGPSMESLQEKAGVVSVNCSIELFRPQCPTVVSSVCEVTQTVAVAACVCLCCGLRTLDSGS